jgi:hypothetical protein
MLPFSKYLFFIILYYIILYYIILYYIILYHSETRRPITAIRKYFVLSHLEIHLGTFTFPQSVPSNAVAFIAV